MTSYKAVLGKESGVEVTLLTDFLDMAEETTPYEEEDDEVTVKIEDLLLQSDPTNAKERKALHKNITKNYSTKAVAVIFFLHLEAKSMYGFQEEDSKDEEGEGNPEEQLQIMQKVRTLFETEIFDQHFRLVKYDDVKIFCISDDPMSAMKGMLCARKWVGNVSTPTMSVQISAGCELGTLFVIKNDYFGDPVNIASKLGEDTAKAGEVFVSLGNSTKESKYIKAFREATFTPRSVHISGVDISYYSMKEKVQRKIACMPKFNSSRSNRSLVTTQLSREITPASFTGGSKKETKREDMIFLQSDLSGFTKLTKKYGILHFLTMILHCRRIFNENLKSCDGAELLMYDGDNIICKFSSSVIALKFILQVYNDVDKYNANKEKDYHIRTKFGLAKGSVLVSEDGDIVGEAWEKCCALSEDKAEVGEILVTEEVKDDLEQHTFGCTFDFRPPCTNCPPHYNVSV